MTKDRILYEQSFSAGWIDERDEPGLVICPAGLDEPAYMLGVSWARNARQMGRYIDWTTSSLRRRSGEGQPLAKAGAS